MSEINVRAMATREERYLGAFPYREGPKAEGLRGELRERYQAPSTSSEEVTRELREFALERGVDLTRVPDSLSGRPFEVDELKASARELARQLFSNPQACCDPDKCALVQAEAETFVDLLGQAREAGSLGNFRAEDAYHLVSGNLVGLALQDRASCETILGDHGVRHLVGHNIAVCDQLAVGLEAQGATLGPVARLMLHQVMLWHDIGYAMQPVRNSINTQGPRGQDAGHAVLAGRLIRERASDPQDPLARVFTPAQLDLIHSCVLYHDMDATGQPGIELSNPDNQAATLESIVRLADNSHAFEDKLPEVLYRHPEAFRTLKLLTVASELGLSDESQDLTRKLRGQLEGGAGRDNREAMEMAARQLGPGSVPFAVSRICAGPGQIQVTGPGQVLVAFEENLNHRDLMHLYDQEPLGQLNRAVRDLTGQTLPEAARSSSLETPGLTVRVRLGEDRSTRETAFQGQLREALEDPVFRGWALGDAMASRQERALRATIDNWSELGEPEQHQHARIYGGQAPLESWHEIRERRAERLRACLKEMEA